jgi:hypothetical protein
MTPLPRWVIDRRAVLRAGAGLALLSCPRFAMAADNPALIPRRTLFENPEYGTRPLRHHRSPTLPRLTRIRRESAADRKDFQGCRNAD